MNPFAFDIQKMLDDPNLPQFSSTTEEKEEAERIATAAFEHPNVPPMPNSSGVLFELAVDLGRRITTENFDQVAPFLTRMDEAGHSEFAVLALRVAHRENNHLRMRESQAYIDLMLGHIGELIAGDD